MEDGLRKMAAVFRKTPLHPQWFAFLREGRNLERSCASLAGIVLDVGCAQGIPRRYLPADADYVGLDYYSTATGWYGTRPDVFGDAQSLPFVDSSIDHALLLAPLALYLALLLPRERAIRAVLPGAAAIMVWFSFAMLYFGAAMPNTYYAKVGTPFTHAVFGLGYLARGALAQGVLVSFAVARVVRERGRLGALDAYWAAMVAMLMMSFTVEPVWQIWIWAPTPASIGPMTVAPAISCISLTKSSSPGAGMIMLSRRPPTSSVMRKKRPRGFSLRVRMNSLRSI